MKYYRAYIVCGSKKKSKQYNRTIFVQTASKEGIGQVFRVVRKIPFGRLISARLISRNEYIAGVSHN